MEDLYGMIPVADHLPEEGVPNIFLSSSFNLEDPDTFYSVFTHVTASGVSLKNAKILQEKVSGHGFSSV